MSAISRLFFRHPCEVQQLSTWSIISWWESRRLIYNVAVGTAGITTLTFFVVVASLSSARVPLPLPWQPLLLYAICANLFYCLGPFLDVLVNRLWGPEYTAVGAALFRYGFAFSVGLTILPIPIFTLDRLLFAMGVFPR